MNPDDKDIKVVLYSNRSQCYLNLKDYNSAEKDSLSALRLDHRHKKSLFRHGTALYQLKKYKEAKREFNNLLKIEPSNKNGLEYLRHTEQKLAKIKDEAYEKLYYGEIIGGSTGIGKNVIKVEEIHMDPKLQQQISNHVTELQEKKEQDLPEHTKENKAERESKNEFLSKTDVSNITRNKEEAKGLDDFVEDAEEQAELRKLEEERKGKKSKKRRKRKDRKSEEGKSDDSPDNISPEDNKEESPLATSSPASSEEVKISLKPTDSSDNDDH